MAPDRVILVIGSDVDASHIRRVVQDAGITALVVNARPRMETAFVSDSNTIAGNLCTFSDTSNWGSNFSNFSVDTCLGAALEAIRGGFRDLSPAQIWDDAERSRVAMANWRRMHRRMPWPKNILPRNIQRFRPIHQPRWSAKRWRSIT